MRLNMPAKNIAHANMNQVKILGKHDRLGAFATTLHAGDYIFTHEYPQIIGLDSKIMITKRRLKKNRKE
jgi:hypothetical protein